MFELPFHPHFLCHYSDDPQASRFCHLHCLVPKTVIIHFLCCPYVFICNVVFFHPFSLLSLIRPASTFFFPSACFPPSAVRLSFFVSRVAHCRLANTHMFNAPVHLHLHCITLLFPFSVSAICKCCASDKHASDDDTIAVLILPMMSFHEALWRSDARFYFPFVYIRRKFCLLLFVFPLNPMFSKAEYSERCRAVLFSYSYLQRPANCRFCMVFVVLWPFEKLSFGTVLFSWVCGCAFFLVMFVSCIFLVLALLVFLAYRSFSSLKPMRVHVTPGSPWA